MVADGYAVVLDGRYRQQLPGSTLVDTIAASVALVTPAAGAIPSCWPAIVTASPYRRIASMRLGLEHNLADTRRPDSQRGLARQRIALRPENGLSDQLV